MITMRIWSGSKRMSRLPERPPRVWILATMTSASVEAHWSACSISMRRSGVRLADLIGSLGNQLVPMRNDQDLPVRLREGLHPRIQA